ncbi:MAG: CheR family methyltransferase [Planctomycetaceae bacterium]
MRYLQENPHEIDSLFKELLIGVTSFFRDPEAWTSLATAVQKLVISRPEEYPLRVWVPGCATGEEAFSMAILLKVCRAAIGNRDVGLSLEESVLC